MPQLLADFATPVPAGLSPTTHLSAVLRAHVDQAAELIRTQHALAEARADTDRLTWALNVALDQLRAIRSRVDKAAGTALDDVRKVLDPDHTPGEQPPRRPG